MMPIALVSSIHFDGDIINEFNPALNLTVSNPTRLNAGLCIFSHIPKNSTVFLFLSQFITTKRGFFLFFFFFFFFLKRCFFFFFIYFLSSLSFFFFFFFFFFFKKKWFFT